MTERRDPVCADSIGPDAPRVDSTGPRMFGVTKPALVDEATVEEWRVAVVVATPGRKPVIVALCDRLAR